MHHMQDGWTALILAAENGHRDCTRLLIEGKADFEITDDWVCRLGFVSAV
jgi:ankyrin repeat protein